MRPIDADKMKSIKSIQSANFNSIESIREWIDEQPTADVVEVIRCKDCKYWNKETDLTYCEKKLWLGTDSTDYCSFGEREDT